MIALNNLTSNPLSLRPLLYFFECCILISYKYISGRASPKRTGEKKEVINILWPTRILVDFGHSHFNEGWWCKNLCPYSQEFIAVINFFFFFFLTFLPHASKEHHCHFFSISLYFVFSGDMFAVNYRTLTYFENWLLEKFHEKLSST